MSRIGKKPILIPDGVTVTIQGSKVSAKGSQGQLHYELPQGITGKIDKGQVVLACENLEDKKLKSNYGTVRSLLANLIQGVKAGYCKELQIQGVGFKAQLQGKKLVMSLGFSHPVEYTVPDGVTVKVIDPTSMSVSGPDKELVGQVSARIRAFYPPEPYKGKGVRYKGEYVRHKAGKTVA